MNKSEVDYLSCGGFDVEVHRRRGLRQLNLAVLPDGRIRIKCGLRRRRIEIEAFVHECTDFIHRRRHEVREMEKRFPPRAIVSGEEFRWMGEKVRLDVIWSWHRKVRVQVTELGFDMVAPLASGASERMKGLTDFYRAAAREWLAARVEFWTRVMGFGPTSMRVRGQRTLWGSCTSAGAISLNWKLMCCPPDVIDYVVVHEMCHLKEQNHSPRFWAWVERFMPDYRRHRKWLKDHQQEIARQFQAARIERR